jgi:pyruvate dehydrogenase E2 component (dihydrolipoamide acetyltransferase)
MAEFKMPSLGADMDAGTLVLWKVKPGDKVKRGDIVAEVETAKGVIEIEVFEEGVVDEIFVNVGTEVPVGSVLARICSEAELTTPVTPKRIVVEHPAAVAQPVVAASPAAAPAPAGDGEHGRSSPLARKVAAGLGVDLYQVHGTGPGGAIQRADVERYAKEHAAPPPVAPAPVPQPLAAAPVEKPVAKPVPVAVTPPVVAALPPAAPAPVVAEAPAAAPVEKKPLDFQTAMRQAIAAAMARSNREIPHYYLETHIDMKHALAWLEEENLKRSMKERLLPVVLLLKATALALTEVSELNGFWTGDHLEVAEEINIGFAIALRQGGLVTPAIHSVDLKTLDELREAVTDLIQRTRAQRLRSSELSDGTVTLTSLGDRGVEKVFGVIYPPQVALVGFGKVIEQPWVENGMLGIRPVLIATLAGDHRATDGHKGALFLEALNRRLQEVEKL